THCGNHFVILKKLGLGQLVWLTVFQGASDNKEKRNHSGCHKSVEDNCPLCPFALNRLELLDAIPALVPPSPSAAFGAKNEEHDEAYKWNEYQKRNKCVISNSPDPVEKKCSPVPSINLRWYHCCLA